VRPAASQHREIRGVSGGTIICAQTDPFVLGSDDPVAFTLDRKGALRK
jgi:hypothetical protein